MEKTLDQFRNHLNVVAEKSCILFDYQSELKIIMTEKLIKYQYR